MASSHKVKKIGIFGGTFNPPHNGHLAVVRAALSRCLLDRVIVIPAPYPPHKKQPLIDFSHRIAMLEEALAGDPNISVSLLEAERQTPSYTIETLNELYKRVGPHQYHLIIGSDSFMEIHLWYRFEEIFNHADLIVAARPGITLVDIENQIASLPGHFSYDRKQQCWLRDDNFRIFYLGNIHVNLSSSVVRNFLKEGKEVKNLLPIEVLDYIYEHELYGVKEIEI